MGPGTGISGWRERAFHATCWRPGRLVGPEQSARRIAPRLPLETSSAPQRAKSLGLSEMGPRRIGLSFTCFCTPETNSLATSTNRSAISQ